MAKTITTVAELQDSAQKFRKELVTMPVIGAQATLQYMTGRPGTVGKETVGELTGAFEIGPYKNTRNGDGSFKITPRTLETFLGNAATKFDPNELWNTIYGSMVSRGESLKNVTISQAILSYATKLLGKNLNMHIWDAKRNPEGDGTKDLFDGFDTITAKEIDTNHTISTEKGNLMELQAFSAENAEDQLVALYEACSDELKEQQCIMYMPWDVLNKYQKDYQASHGALPYNTQYKKHYLDVAGDMVELVPLVSKKGSNFIHIAPKSNMLYGYGNGAEKESIGVEKYEPWMLTLEATLFFGVQMESINKERLMVGKIAPGA